MDDQEKQWKLTDKKYVVTGGTKGIGYQITRSLLGRDCRCVLICARTQADVETAVDELNKEFASSKGEPRVKGIACDVSSEEGRATLVAEAARLFDDKLDGLLNNVGTNIRKPIAEQTKMQYHIMMTTNVDSTYFLCQQFLPLLQAAGTASPNASSAVVVNVTSAAGVQSSGTGAVYGMSKAAIIQLTKILSCEWANKAKYNIRVNAIAPWMTLTPMLEEAVKANPSQLDKVHEWTPMGRLAQAQEIAGPAVFLCLGASSYMTGQCLGVDGGLTAQGFDGPCCDT